MILTEKDLQLLKSLSAMDQQMTRKDPELKIEFDGTTVLCRVCGDKASGFHYGVHSCEGCKGFFRRSIQQKIQYRPCTKNQQCSILRINRNRCQYCRLKKCIAVGMSRDAVRFGRVPKREKAKILAAMQSVNARSQERAMTAELEDESRLIATIVQAHEQTCDYTQEKVAPLLQRAHDDPIYTQCPPTLACPLNPNPQPLQNGNQRILEDFSERFSPAIRGVVEFAKRIPGFSLLSQDDQVTLLKAGVFEVLLVRLACMFDSQSNLMLCLNGQVLKRESLHNTSNARFLMDSMFDFAERINILRLRDGELGLFCAVVIIAADRPGLRNAELVEKMQSKMMQSLQTVVMQSHPEMPGLFQELLKKIPDLRTLNTLHSEKLLAFKMEPHHQDAPSLSALSASTINSYITPQQHGGWGSNEYAVAAGLVPGDDSKGSWEERELIQSPGQRSSSSAGSEWSLAESKETDDYCSPQYTVSSKGDNESVCSSEVAQITELHSKRRREHSHSEGISSGDEGSVVDSPSRCPFKLRKLESPSDSGIESGKEIASNGSQSTGTSMCGSPRSLVEEKVKDVDLYESERGDPTDDMPVLKRALQAPPLINTNLLMDEAYKPHKKFRALRKEAELPSSVASDAAMPQSASNTPASSLSLASTHSVLVRSLEQGPRMTEQQLKRTDIIHNIIMRNESHVRHEAIVAAYTSAAQATTTSSSIMANGGNSSGEQVLYGMPQLATPSFFAPSQQSSVSASATCPKNMMVCAPPGYYIPQQQQNSAASAAQYQNNNWPFISPAVSNAGLAVQVRPSATYVPNVQPLSAVQQQQQPNMPPQLSPQPHQQQRMVSMVASPTATSPQPANVPPASPSSTSTTQLPRMYYDPRSTTPTSAAVSPAVPCSTSYQCYGSTVVAGSNITNSKRSSPKPTSPLAGQVMELLRVDIVSENQPLNLSKKVASPPPTPTQVESTHFQKVKLEDV